MRLLYTSGRTSLRHASPTRQSVRPKPVGPLNTRLPRPVYCTNYRSSQRVTAAYSITKIPFIHTAPARAACIRSVRLDAQDVLQLYQQAEGQQLPHMITEEAMFHAAAVSRYPAASTMLDYHSNTDASHEYCHTAKLPGYRSCLDECRSGAAGQKEALHLGSQAGLGRLRRSLARMQSVLRDDPPTFQQASSSEGEETFDDVRLKLAQRRSEVVGSMLSLRKALHKELSGMFFVRYVTAIGCVIPTRYGIITDFTGNICFKMLVLNCR